MKTSLQKSALGRGSWLQFIMVVSALSSASIFGVAATSSLAHADPADVGPQILNSVAPTKNYENERDFYQVLEDVLGDFEFDLKNGNVSGLKDLSIRNVAVSENIPTSFKNHLELLVTERILRATKTRMIQCLPCRAKRTQLNGDQMTISSPESNPGALARIAKEAGIANFMDIAFSYQPTGIILSLYITDPDSEAVVWSRSYNSEASRAAAQRRGADFSQSEDARKATEYVPIVQYRITALYLFEPNVGKSTGCLGAAFRMMERYDNRKKEVGFELNYLKDSSSIVGAAPTAGSVNLYSGFNLTLLFVHAWNLIGEEENFNRPRGSVFAGVGGTYSSGFLGGLIRGGYEWRLGKKSAISANLGYRPSATAFLANTAVTSVSGLEYGLGVSLMF